MTRSRGKRSAEPVGTGTMPGTALRESEADRSGDTVLGQTTPAARSAASSSLSGTSAPGTVAERESPGQPLPAAARAEMEQRFGHDFSRVRVADDAEANRLASERGARAFTLGENVQFAKGEFAPNSPRGRDLLVHELAHVVQQSRGGTDPNTELRADRAAARVAEGGSVSESQLGGAPLSVQAKPDEPATKPANTLPAVDPNGWSETIDKFGHNSAVLTARQNKAVDALASAIIIRLGLLTNSRATIAIIGHTDTSGDETHNEGLGLKRADATKAALEAILATQRLSAGRIAAITIESAGETRLAKPTRDGVKEPLNRRVEIVVKFEGPPPPAATPAPTPAPEQQKRPLDLNVPPESYLPKKKRPPWRDPDDLWQRMEENQRRIEEFDRKHPRKPKSATDVIVDAVTRALDPVLKKLPKELREKARQAIRKGIESGTEKGCEAAVDASGVQGAEAEAMKAACKAALKTKPGENR